jgi:arginine/serine-rich splicing factor 7
MGSRSRSRSKSGSRPAKEESRSPSPMAKRTVTVETSKDDNMGDNEANNKELSDVGKPKDSGEKRKRRNSSASSRGRSRSRSRSKSRSRSGGERKKKSRSRSRTPRRSRRSRTRSRSRSRSRSNSPRRGGRGGGGGGGGGGDWSFDDQGPEDGYRLHVADLDTGANKRDLEKLFGKFGPLKEIWMARSVPCFAFCVYRYREDAEEAQRKSDGAEVSGRRIRVTIARPRTRGRGRRGFDPGMRCYQCGERGHFSRDCPDSKWGYKRPPSPRRNRDNYERRSRY